MVITVWRDGCLTKRFEACPDTILSSRLPTVSAHTLQLCEPTVPRSIRGWPNTHHLSLWMITGLISVFCERQAREKQSKHLTDKDFSCSKCLIELMLGGHNSSLTVNAKHSETEQKVERLVKSLTWLGTVCFKQPLATLHTRSDLPYLTKRGCKTPKSGNGAFQSLKKSNTTHFCKVWF